MTSSNSSSAPLPLDGIKVVELSHLIAGPYCCQMLADEGATVIKVEPPNGELTRHRLPARRTASGEVTAYYASLNRGKKSLVLDLKNAVGRAQVEDEAVSNFSGSNNFHGIPYGAFPASDGAVSLGVNRDDFWVRFCVAMGRPELGTDPRYATYVERAKRQREVHAIAEEF